MYQTLPKNLAKDTNEGVTTRLALSNKRYHSIQQEPNLKLGLDGLMRLTSMSNLKTSSTKRQSTQESSRPNSQRSTNMNLLKTSEA